MRSLPGTPVFTFDEAAACGWSASALKNAVRHGRLVRLRRGVYALADLDGPSPTVLRIEAAARAHENAVVSHRSAALLHGLPIVGPQPSRPDLTVPPRSNANMPDVHVYRAQLREHEVVELDRIAVTSVARTVSDMGRHVQAGATVAAADHALHRSWTTPEEIADVLDFCRSWPGAAAARRALRLVDARSESPLESISRLVLPRLGLPKPEPQARILTRTGEFIGRCDFYWDEFGVVGEADGRDKYDERPVLTDEKERQEKLEDLGLVAVRWGWTHATRHHDLLRSKLRNGFERGRRRDLSGFPRLWLISSTGVAQPARGRP